MTMPNKVNFVNLGETPYEDWPNLLTPGEVAALFRVDPKTVTRWAAAGKISSIRTLGEHRRFSKESVREAWLGDTNQ
jgi:excisionase family DNA binding protein